MENIISDKAIEEVMTRIDILAEKLGVTAEYLFGIYIKQAYISGIGCCAFLIGIFCGFGMYFYLGKLIHKKVNDGWDDDILVPYYILFVIGSVAGLIGIFVLPYDILTAFINPEYWAFDKLVASIK